MIKNYLLITLRSLLKNKLFVSINIVGMGISIACCIVAYYNYDFNASFDTNHVHAGEIYRISSVREFQGRETKYGYAPVPLGEVAKENIGDIDQVVRFSPTRADIRIGDEIFNTGLTYVDAPFFEVFTFDFVEGDGKDLKDKTKIFINDKLATKYFGNEPALGKPITQIVNNEFREYTVGGVFREQPRNSSFWDDAYAVYDNYFDLDPDLQDGSNWRYRNNVFIQIKDPNRVKAVSDQLQPYRENNNKIREDFIINRFVLDPFVGMAVRDEVNDINGSWTRDAVPIAAVMGTAVMSILVLLIACFNLTNTSIAMASRRLKEIGIRKVMGSPRIQLITQYIGETMLICLIALGIGMLVASLILMPAFNEMWSFVKLEPNYLGDPTFWIFAMSILLFTAILAGSYPAFYISKFQPTQILKGKLKFGGTNFFTRFLLVMQFMITLIGIVSSIAFIQNAKYQRELDLGFTQKGVVFTYVNDQSEFETYRNALQGNPEILSIAGSPHHLFSNLYNDPIKFESKEIEVDIMNVGDDYIKTVGMQLTAGRDFTKDSETDKKESVIVTEGLAKAFGWDEPLGKEIIWADTVHLFVIGVIKDIYTNGLWDQLEPMMLRYAGASHNTHVIVSGPAQAITRINDYMEKKWHEVFPNRKYFSRYMDEQMAEAVTVNNNIVQMFLFLGTVAIMLSATGLFTLVSLNIIKKMKEIGVRKVLGASISNITRIINTEFVVILLISSVLGCGAGWWLVDMLMDSIWDYYMASDVVTFVVAVATLFLISAVTVGFKVYNTAKMNPVSVLRDE